MGQKGILYGIGLGPGDPELITLKGLKAIERADVVAYHQAKDKVSHAWQIAQNFIRNDQIKLPLIYPLTKELPPESQNYQIKMDEFYQQIAAQIGTYLDTGRHVSVIVAGDPLLYSSFQPIYQRLVDKYEIIIIPGIISASAAAAAARWPLCQGNESFTILSALLPEDTLLDKLSKGGTFAILKLGAKNFDKIRRCLQRSNRADQAIYIEAATLPSEAILDIEQVEADKVPYFSLILVGA